MTGIGILDQIDDTLDNWTGSLDSMRWQPPATFASERARLLQAMGTVQRTFSLTVEQLATGRR